MTMAFMDRIELVLMYALGRPAEIRCGEHPPTAGGRRCHRRIPGVYVFQVGELHGGIAARRVSDPVIRAQSE